MYICNERSMSISHIAMVHTFVCTFLYYFLVPISFFFFFFFFFLHITWLFWEVAQFSRHGKMCTSFSHICDLNLSE